MTKAIWTTAGYILALSVAACDGGLPSEKESTDAASITSDRDASSPANTSDAGGDPQLLMDGGDPQTSRDAEQTLGDTGTTTAADGETAKGCPSGADFQVSGCNPNLKVVPGSVVIVPAGSVALATPVTVTFGASGAQQPINITFTINGSFDAASVSVVRVGPSGGAATAITQQPTISGNTVTVAVSEDGTYAVVEQIRPLAGCADKFLKSNINAQSNADLNALDGVTRLDGSLSIGGTVNDLAKLRCLTAITGSLTVSSANALVDMSLDGLAQLTGQLVVQSSSALKQVKLPRLRSVGASGNYSVYLASLTELVNVDIGGVVELPQGLYLGDLGSTGDAPLTASFASLTTLGGGLTVTSSSSILNLDGFRALSAVSGTITVSSNKALTSAAALSAVQRVGGGVVIQSDNKLTTIDLKTLTSVGGASANSLVFYDLPELVSANVSALGETAGTLYLVQLGMTGDSPLTLNFGALTTVRGNLTLNNAASLTNLDGFAKLTTVDGNVSIQEDDGLLQANGLAKLKTVGGQLQLQGDDLLTAIDLSALTDVGNAAGNSIILSALNELVSVKAGALGELPAVLYLTQLGATADGPLTLDFGQLTIVRGAMYLNGLTRLQNLDGFAKLTTVTGALNVNDNPELQNANGLAALKTVSGAIQLNNDAKLTTIDLRALTNVGSAGNGYSLLFTSLPKLTNVNCSALGETAGGLDVNAVAETAGAPLVLNFANLTTMRGWFFINTAGTLADLNGFAKLTTINGGMTISNNNALASIAGLNTLSTLTGNLTIQNNAQLPTCAAKALRDRVKAGVAGQVISGNWADGC